MPRNVEKTHRCDELLAHNKDYNNGDTIRIFYGYRFGNPYNEKNGETKGWWLEHLEWDMDWDTKYMSTVCRIRYCPCCGIDLNTCD